MRIRWVDYGKGFAIFLVIIGHVALGSLQSGQYSGMDLTILHIILEMTYAIHIPVFFALSGYFFKPITKASQILRREAKRGISLGVPYLFFSIIMVVLKSIGGSSVRNQDGLSGLLNIYRTPIDYLWFLYALFFVDLFISLLSLLLKSKVIISVILVLGFILQTIHPFSIEAISNVLLWSPFFYLGFLLKNRQISKRLAYISYFVYVLHIPVFCIMYPNEYYLFGFWRVVSIFAVFMMFYFFSKRKGTEFDFLEWCGLNSIILYLVHAPVASVIRILLFKIGISALFLQVTAQLFFSVLVSLVVARLSSKFSLIGFLFKPLKFLKQ